MSPGRLPAGRPWSRKHADAQRRPLDDPELAEGFARHEQREERGAQRQPEGLLAPPHRLGVAVEDEPFALDDLDLDVADAVLRERLARWSPPPPVYVGGVMAKYAALVSSASTGAVTTGRRMTAALGTSEAS